MKFSNMAFMINMKFFSLITLLISTVPAFAQTPFQAIVTKSEREIIPEGIVVNPADGKIYVSSIGLKKILVIDSTGSHQDFIKAEQDGFLEGLGMKIDSKSTMASGSTTSAGIAKPPSASATTRSMVPVAMPRYCTVARGGAAPGAPTMRPAGLDILNGSTGRGTPWHTYGGLRAARG